MTGDLMRLNNITIYAIPENGFCDEQTWVVHNIAYIYSESIYQRKLDFGKFGRINIYLNDVNHKYSGEPHNSCLSIGVSYSPDDIDVDDPYGTQVRLVKIITAVLKRLPNHDYGSIIDECHNEVMASGFSIEGFMTRTWNRSPNRQYAVRLGFKTTFDRIEFFCDVRIGRTSARRIHLCYTRPSSFLAQMSVKSVAVDDNGEAAVVLRRPDEKYLNMRLFGLLYYDITDAPVAVSSEDRKDAIVLKLKCAGFDLNREK
jgi:hypothetical protein